MVSCTALHGPELFSCRFLNDENPEAEILLAEVVDDYTEPEITGLTPRDTAPNSTRSQQNSGRNSRPPSGPTSVAGSGQGDTARTDGWQWHWWHCTDTPPGLTGDSDTDDTVLTHHQDWRVTVTLMTLYWHTTRTQTELTGDTDTDDTPPGLMGDSDTNDIILKHHQDWRVTVTQMTLYWHTTRSDEWQWHRWHTTRMTVTPMTLYWHTTRTDRRQWHRHCIDTPPGLMGDSDNDDISAVMIKKVELETSLTTSGLVLMFWTRDIFEAYLCLRHLWTFWASLRSWGILKCSACWSLHMNRYTLTFLKLRTFCQWPLCFKLF